MGARVPNCLLLPRSQSYSVEVHEHTNTRTLPEALYGVLTVDEYLVRRRMRCSSCAELTPLADSQHVFEFALREVSWLRTLACQRR